MNDGASRSLTEGGAEGPATGSDWNPEIMEDLITAAVNKALEDAENVGKEEISKISSEFMPKIPGFDPSKFGM